MAYKIVFSKQAYKDLDKMKQNPVLTKKLKNILDIVKDTLYNNHYCKKLVGNLNGLYSIRINIAHRFVYKVEEQDQTVHVLSVWSHYEGL